MSLEKELSVKTKRANLQKIILGTIRVTGVLAVGLVAPNVLWAMKKIGLFPHKRQKESISLARRRLIQKGFLQYEKGMLKITLTGKKFLIFQTFLDKTRDKTRKWDKKWRILIFDIPEYRKSDREHIRYMLYSIGFKQLQKSVWIYPYDCEDLITLLKADLKIGKNVLYIVAEALEYDAVIKEYFNLK